jgi:hypothetical protein
MRRDRRRFLQRFSQGPVAARVMRACHPWRWLVFEVARSPASPCAPVRRRPSGRSRPAVRRHRRQLHGLMPRRAPELSRVPSRRLPPRPRLRRSRRAEPDPTHLAVRGSFLSWNFLPCRWPVSRCPRERPLPEASPPPSADGCHPVGLAPPSWFRTTSTASSVHGSRRVAAGTGSRFARFRPDRSSKPKLLGPGPELPAGAPPFEGFLLVGSRAASLRPAPLLPFVAGAPSREGAWASLRPRPLRPKPRAETRWVRAGRSVPAGPPSPTVRQGPGAVSLHLSVTGFLLRCAVRPSTSGLPRSRPRRAPGPCRVAGRPALALPAGPSPRGEVPVGSGR